MDHFSFLSINLKGCRLCRRITTLALVSGVLLIHLPLLAQKPYKVSIPGTSFSPQEYDKKKVKVEDLTGGRRSFRGQTIDSINLRANLPMPPLSKVARHEIERLVIHFKSERDGPSLRTVEVRNGSALRWKRDMRVDGDYTTRETEYPKPGANVWDWSDGPIKVDAQSWLRVAIQFSNGFDDPLDPAREFILIGVDVYFPFKDLGGSPIKRKDSTKTRDILS